jgi:hypothetical protein
VSVVLVAASATACDRKPPEPAAEHRPAPRPATSSTTAAASRSAPDAGPADDLTPAEQRDRKVRLHNELCEEAAKHANRLNNRSETDPKGIQLLATCLRYGTVAWYRCTLNASSPNDVELCSRRLLAVE